MHTMKVVDKCLSAFLRSILLEMKRAGLTQTELAQRLEVSRPYLSKVLHGDVNISFGSALRLAQALGKDFKTLLAEPPRKRKASVVIQPEYNTQPET